ncbi:MAG: sodium:calcium antiporter [Clostridia bacterium]|nr:sodium:calcium antiporter [Clostridia bacterium]
MEILIAVVLLAVGIVLIVKGGDFFVDAASWFAEVSGIPKLIVGATVVSFATTLPELLVSAFAAVEARSTGDLGLVDMAIGNAVGSVTANLGLIFAIALIAMPTVIRRKDYLLKMLLMLGAAAAVVVFSLLFEGVGLTSSIILLAIFAVAMFDNIRTAVVTVRANKAAGVNDEKRKPTKTLVAINIGKFLVGAAGIVFGADLLVDNASDLAALCGVSDRVISVTIVAIGTSLPELVTTLTAIVKKQASLSAGNIIGANIIDLTLILPVCAVISGGTLPVVGTVGILDMPACLLIGAVACIPTMFTKKFARWQGILLLGLYAVYMVLTIFFGDAVLALVK